MSCNMNLHPTLRTTKGPQEVGGKLTTSVRVQTQDWKVLLEPLAELDTNSADPRDHNIRDLPLAPQGEDRGVARVVVDNQQKVPPVALSTDAGWAPHVQVESLQGSLCRGERGGVRNGVLPPPRHKEGWEGQARVGGGAETWEEQRQGDWSACHGGVPQRGDQGGGAKGAFDRHTLPSRGEGVNPRILEDSSAHQARRERGEVET
ncbi:unnamed protein product [Closterium sp. NIES-65]|nr:unnamed protein product [Closterium sp. NIES-65]